MKIQRLLWIVWVLNATVIAAIFSGCGRPNNDGSRPLDLTVPNIPVDTNFGPLYPHVNAYLNTGNPDVISAVRDTRAWAEQRLEGFRTGSCASAQVVGDLDFARAFGRTTLGVTLPWMQIYIRDGKRSGNGETFLWTDPSLFVSTILHEFEHAIQRATQSQQAFGSGNGDCEGARGSLTARIALWSAGFEMLRLGRMPKNGYSDVERALLYHWSSPITRARDEVEASLATVKWMDAFPNDLNAYTMGGANNWVYAVEYLNQLKNLATSNCFSPDDQTFEDEKAIFEKEVPFYVSELQRFETGMRAVLDRPHARALRMPLNDLVVGANPTGRLGAACAPVSQLNLPSLNASIE